MIVQTISGDAQIVKGGMGAHPKKEDKKINTKKLKKVLKNA